MALSRKSLDIDTLNVRNIYARYPNNGIIPSSHVLTTDGKGGTTWFNIADISGSNGGNTNLSTISCIISNISSVNSTIAYELSIFSALPPPLINQGLFNSISTNTITVAGKSQPVIQYGVGTISTTGRLTINLNSSYVNNAYVIQLTYRNNNLPIHPLSYTNIQSGSFDVYGDRLSQFAWTAYGNIF